MKLINKTILNYLFISIPLFIIVGIISYFLIKSELRDGMDENLEREKLNAELLIESLKEPANTNLSYDGLSFIKVIQNGSDFKDRYSDTSIYDAKKKETLNYRVLKSLYHFKGTSYQITLTRTTIEEEELMSSLFSAFVLVIIFIILSFFSVSWMLSKKLWTPFYETLSGLSNYDLKKHTTTHFKQEKIEEFNRLNTELNKMTAKIHQDFLQQKEFTENASHELQTPLSVVRANLSLLMQSPVMQEPEMDKLGIIENTIRKLTSLNKSLILLAKIENNQYHETQPVKLAERIEASLELFSGAIQAKNISVTTHLASDAVITMNPALADVLINNLLQNAIRHNSDHGLLNIELNANALSVSNSGAPLTITEEELFVRFKKNDGSKDSLGLGLSIVKGIVVLYGIDLKYSYHENVHSFILIF